MTRETIARWRTAVGDSLGLVAIIWSIPLAIIVVGLPVVLLFLGAQMVAQLIF